MEVSPALLLLNFKSERQTIPMKK